MGEAMWLMLQHNTPQDLVIATGQAHSVREFAERAFAHGGLSLRWEGEGAHTVGICIADGRELVAIDPNCFRPNEVNRMLGDPSRAKSVLGWSAKMTFDQLVSEM